MKYFIKLLKYFYLGVVSYVFKFFALIGIRSNDHLIKIFQEHKGNISDKWENYLSTYNKEFQKFKDKKIALLEIGVQNGGSLQIWSKFFNDVEVIGIDIEPDTEKLNLGEKITTLRLDATSSVDINEALGNREFDIIVDDGSHCTDQIIKSFEILYPRLKYGGKYVVEDLHCSYWESHNGGYKKGAIEYFKNLIDLLNFDHHKNYGDTPNSKLVESYIDSILSIKFEDSLVIVEKKGSGVKKPFKRILTGLHGPIIQYNEEKYKNWFDNTKDMKLD